jgi:hypothetical protein
MEQIKGMFKPFEKIIEQVITTKIQSTEAKAIAIKRNLPKGDVIHAILARDNRLILVTRDNHFRKLSDLAEFYKPEEIIS